jgi:hypothetical protein
MRIPNVPTTRIVDKEGIVTPQWAAFLRNLITQLRLNVSDEGYVFPFLTNAEVLQLNNTDNIGKILYNSTTQQMMVNNTGTFEVIDTV